MGNRANPCPLTVHIAVAGTDGVGVNARTWASAAKAGMKQAAAPQEKARPCAFQPTVAINTAKGKFIPWRLYPTCVCVCVVCAGEWVLNFIGGVQHEEFIMIIIGRAHLFCNTS